MIVEDLGRTFAEESGAVDGAFVGDCDAFAEMSEPHEEGDDAEGEDRPEGVGAPHRRSQGHDLLFGSGIGRQACGGGAVGGAVWYDVDIPAIGATDFHPGLIVVELQQGLAMIAFFGDQRRLLPRMEYIFPIAHP